MHVVHTQCLTTTTGSLSSKEIRLPSLSEEEESVRESESPLLEKSTCHLRLCLSAKFRGR